MKPEELAEYNQMRSEILARATMHHNQLTQAVVLQLLCVGVVVWLAFQQADWQVIELFLLLASAVFTLLTFNYQANQCTMESVAKYLDHQYGKVGLEWERFFAKEKARNQMVSFGKAFPLVWPQFVPIVIWRVNGWPVSQLQSALLVVNIILLVWSLVNFKYKLGK